MLNGRGILVGLGTLILLSVVSLFTAFHSSQFTGIKDYAGPKLQQAVWDDNSCDDPKNDLSGCRGS